MRPYSTDSDERRWVTVYLVVISILLGRSSSELTAALSWWGQWVWDFSAVAWFLLVYWLTDHYLWKLRWFHWPFLFQLPNLNGTWTGELRSSWTEFSETKPCTMVVRQTWTRLHVDFCLNEKTSGSHSVAACLLLDYQGKVTLRYEYLNDPGEEHRGVLDKHGGTTQLALVCDDLYMELDGRYYTDRLTQTRGTIAVRKLA